MASKPSVRAAEKIRWICWWKEDSCQIKQHNIKTVYDVAWNQSLAERWTRWQYQWKEFKTPFEANLEKDCNKEDKQDKSQTKSAEWLQLLNSNKTWVGLLQREQDTEPRTDRSDIQQWWRKGEWLEGWGGENMLDRGRKEIWRGGGGWQKGWIGFTWAGRTMWTETKMSFLRLKISQWWPSAAGIYSVYVVIIK